MSNYKMNIFGQIDLSDYSYIHDYIAVIEPSDSFQIMMNNVEEDDEKVICSILECDKFDIVGRTKVDQGEYCIKATKRY